MAQEPPVGKGLLTDEASRSHSRHTTRGRIPLDELSARRTYLSLTTRLKKDSHSIPQFQQLSGRRQTSDRAATGPEYQYITKLHIFVLSLQFIDINHKTGNSLP